MYPSQKPRFLSRVAMMALCMFSLALSAQIDPGTEAQGIDETVAGTPPVRNPQARALAMRALRETGLLLIPESTNDRVMAFDPMTGDLVDPDFIPSDPDNLSTPICAILSAAGDSILVSDQLDDVVQEYDMDGNFLGTFAPAGGADTAILDNIRGITLSPEGNLLVTVGAGPNTDAVASFDGSGNFLGNLVANGAGGLDSPFDVLLRNSDYLVGGINNDEILGYDLTGAFNSTFSPINSFPEQIIEIPSGNILVANFSGTEEGVVEYTSTGTQIGIYDPASVGAYRGVYELPNGNILTTNGDGVHEIDRAGNLVETKIGGVSARFIEFLGPSFTCDPVTIEVNIGGDIIITGTPGCPVDLYDTSCSSNTQIWVLLAGGLTIPDGGTLVVPGLTGEPDRCYVATVAGDPAQALNDPVQTIPTLGPYALAAFVLLLLVAGVWFLRRKRQTV